MRPRADNAPATPRNTLYERSTPGDYTRSHPRRTVRRGARNPSYPGIAISGARHPRQYAGIVRALARNPRGCTSVIARFTEFAPLHAPLTITDRLALTHNLHTWTHINDIQRNGWESLKSTTNRKMGAVASDFAYSPTLSRTASGAVYNAPTSEGLRSSALTVAEVLGLFVGRCTTVALCAEHRSPWRWGARGELGRPFCCFQPYSPQGVPHMELCRFAVQGDQADTQGVALSSGGGAPR